MSLLDFGVRAVAHQARHKPKSRQPSCRCERTTRFKVETNHTASIARCTWGSANPRTMSLEPNAPKGSVAVLSIQTKRCRSA